MIAFLLEVFCLTRFPQRPKKRGITAALKFQNDVSKFVKVNR